MNNIRVPKGLEYHGIKLWKSITDEFDLENEPHKRRVLFDAAKTADMLDSLEKGMEGQPLTVTGSANQIVIHPLIAEQRVCRALLSTLLDRLRFEEGNE